MSKGTAEKYLKGRDGYCWHISELKIYDQPRELPGVHRLAKYAVRYAACGDHSTAPELALCGGIEQ